jgi:phage terminase large subunit-like protein
MDKGNQKPRLDIYHDGDICLAEKTIALLDGYNRTPLQWQKSVLRRWMARDDEDKWANQTCGLIVPRQNGKSWLAEARILGGMIFMGEHLIYSAHQVSTVDEIKRRILRFFYDAEPEIRDLLTSEFDKEPKSFDYIELRNGGRCIFRTRTRSSGLGFTSDAIINDECQEESDAQEEALLPTISAGPLQNPQVIMMGTPPTAGSTGTVFLRARRNLLQGKADMCWQEWSVETITDNHDTEAWYRTNPSLGYLITEKAIRAESNAMSQDSFNKMRLGWIPGVDAQRVFTDDEWNALAIKEVKLPEEPELVYAVKFAPDRSSVTLAVGVPIDEKIHVEIVERKRMSEGIAWLVKWLLDRWRNCNQIIIDGAAGQGLLIEELLRSEPKMKKRILTPNVREAGSAYALFYQAIQDGTLTHYNQPILNTAIRTAKRRDIGKDGMFGYASLNPNVQMDAVDAAAFAYYGANRFKGKKRAASRQTFMAY